MLRIRAHTKCWPIFNGKVSAGAAEVYLMKYFSRAAWINASYDRAVLYSNMASKGNCNVNILLKGAPGLIRGIPSVGYKYSETKSYHNGNMKLSIIY